MKDDNTDLVNVYIMRSWPNHVRNNDMDTTTLQNAVCIVTTALGDEMVRAFEGQSAAAILYKVFEAVRFWDEQHIRSIVVNKVSVKDVELLPYQVWNLLSQFADRNNDTDKWPLKVHVDRYGQRWHARQEPHEAEAGVGGEDDGGDESWRYDPNLVPAKGDK